MGSTNIHWIFYWIIFSILDGKTLTYPSFSGCQEGCLIYRFPPCLTTSVEAFWIWFHAGHHGKGKVIWILKYNISFLFFVEAYAKHHGFLIILFACCCLFGVARCIIFLLICKFLRQNITTINEIGICWMNWLTLKH